MPITKTGSATATLTRAQLEAALGQVATCVQEIEDELGALATAAGSPSTVERIVAKVRGQLRTLTLAHDRACKAVESLG